MIRLDHLGSLTVDEYALQKGKKKQKGKFPQKQC